MLILTSSLCSPVKSSTMPTMSPVTSHHTSVYSHSHHDPAPAPAPAPGPARQFAEIDTSALSHRSANNTQTPCKILIQFNIFCENLHKDIYFYETYLIHFIVGSRAAIREAGSPVLAYSKPADPSRKKAEDQAQAEAANGSVQQLELQKELSQAIRHRRRSHSMSSRGERGIFNVLSHENFCQAN